MLTPDAKAIILCLSPKPYLQKSKFMQSPRQQNPPLPRRTVHELDIEYVIACLHELHGGGGDTPPNEDNCVDTSVHEDIPEADGQPLLAHMTKKKPLPPGNVKRLLSQPATKPSNTGLPQEVNLNGITYR